MSKGLGYFTKQDIQIVNKRMRPWCSISHGNASENHNVMYYHPHMKIAKMKKKIFLNVGKDVEQLKFITLIGM